MRVLHLRVRGALVPAFPLDTSPRIAKVAGLDKNNAQACSSVGEHYLDTVGVGGSIPPMPTDLSSRGLERQGAECYPALPLTQQTHSSLSFSKFALAAQCGCGLRSECRARE